MSVTWDSPVDRLMLGPYLLKDLGNIFNKVQQHLKEAQDRQKNYADMNRKDKQYQVVEHTYLKVKAKKSPLVWEHARNWTPDIVEPLKFWLKEASVAYE